MSGSKQREQVRDVVLGVVLAASAVLEHLAPPRAAPWWEVVLGATTLFAGALISRRHPLIAVIVTALYLLVPAVRLQQDPTGPFPVSYLGALILMAYFVGRRMPRTRSALILLMVVAFGGMGLLIVLNVTNGVADSITYGISNWIAVTPLVVLPWLVGRYRRLYVDLVSAGWERAAHLEREQRMIAERERLAERTRIAEDMHDSLGHELSLIALRAGALELAPDLPERHRQAAADLRLAAANATDQLHDIIGVLRDGDAPVEPVRGSVTDLVERAQASGMTVTLHVDSSPDDASPDDASPEVAPPPMVSRAAYRVVQEALTNVTKHAPGGAVTVRVTHTADETTVTVRNAAPPGDLPPVSASGGRGLLGLAERVRLLGGTLHTGQTSDSGFEVQARLPHVGTATSQRDDDDTVGESAHHREQVRRRIRRGLVTAILAPAGVVAGMVALFAVYYVYASYHSVLPPAAYEALHIGQERATIAKNLPRLQMFDAPSEKLPDPPGARCEFYRPDGTPFAITYAYRLCFADGRLIAKDVVPTGSRPATPRQSATPNPSR